MVGEMIVTPTLQHCEKLDGYFRIALIGSFQITNVVPADDGYGSRVNVPTILLSWADSELLR